MCIEHMIYFPVYLLCLSCLCIVRFSFLDSRTFVTCSDDTTVCLWDARYLKHKIRTLQGHSNWVKNIEYSSSEDLLLTSGFDGSIYTWDINRYDTEITINFKSLYLCTGTMGITSNALKYFITCFDVYRLQ